MNKLSFAKSNAYREKIHNLIPGGAHTYSKGDDQFPALAPAAIARGKGAYIWDIDGNKYLDCAMGLSSVSLGHAYEPVLARVREELEKGVNFQRPGEIELEMAELFLSLIPSHQMIKFAKNGSTATTAAVKLARAYTGRPKVAIPVDHPFYSYDDWFIGRTPVTKGIPTEIANLSVPFDSRDLRTLEKAFLENPGQIACVISEPERAVPMDQNFLERVIAISHKNGALFIQDEMITGFKYDLPGVINHNKVAPDLATWGKGCANGFSFCALTGKKEVMELGGIRRRGAEKVFLISTTHGGETHAIGAGIATIQEYQKKNVIAHNKKIARAFIDEIGALVSAKNLGDFVKVIDCDWLPMLQFRDRAGNLSDGLRTLVMQEMIQRGVLFQAAFVPSFSHSLEDVALFKDAFGETLGVYAQALDQGWEKLLVGEPAKPVFRKTL